LFYTVLPLTHQSCLVTQTTSNKVRGVKRQLVSKEDGPDLDDTEEDSKIGEDLPAPPEGAPDLDDTEEESKIGEDSPGGGASGSEPTGPAPSPEVTSASTGQSGQQG
jgi:hypothetical protein